MRNWQPSIAVVTTFLTVTLSGVAEACTVCYGAANSAMVLGARYAVFFLLFVVIAVLACFAAFFVYLSKRAKLCEGC